MPQKQKIERYLRSWRTNWEIIMACGTVCPTKRISEFRATGRLEQRPMPSNPKLQQYRLRPVAA
jgi:hypothetical protein